MSDKELIDEVLRLTSTGSVADQTFPAHEAALKEAETWLRILRRFLPPETPSPIGVLVDGNRVVVFNAALWLNGEVDIAIESPTPILHFDPRLPRPGALH